MSDKCIMCGASERTTIHALIGSGAQWTHTLYVNMRPEDAKRTERSQCSECSMELMIWSNYIFTVIAKYSFYC